MASGTVVPSQETLPVDLQTAVLTPETKAAWNEGKEAPKAAPAPAKTSSDSETQVSDKTAAVTEPAKQQEKKKSDAATRLNEILEDLKKAGLSPAELKTYKRQAEAKIETKQETTSPAAEKKPEAVAKPKLDDKTKDGAPKYKSYQEWEDAKDEWVANEAVRKSQEAREKQAREASQKEQSDRASKVWLDRVAETRKNIADFDDVVSNKEHPIYKIPTGSVLENFIFQAAEHGPEVLHHLMSKADEFKRIMEITDRITLDRELWKLDFSFTKPEKKETPAQRKTQAPPPIKEVGGRASETEDEVTAALKAHPERLTREAKAAMDRQYAARAR
jgi:hypothetical protein